MLYHDKKSIKVYFYLCLSLSFQGTVHSTTLACSGMTPSTEISLLSASCSNSGHHGQQRAHNGGSDAKNLTPSAVPPLLLDKTDFVERYREFHIMPWRCYREYGLPRQGKQTCWQCEYYTTPFVLALCEYERFLQRYHAVPHTSTLFNGFVGSSAQHIKNFNHNRQPICPSDMRPRGVEDDNDDDADNSTNTERLFDVLANLMYSASCLLRFLLILIRLHLGKWRSYQIKAKIRDVKEGET